MRGAGWVRRDSKRTAEFLFAMAAEQGAGNLDPGVRAAVVSLIADWNPEFAVDLVEEGIVPGDAGGFIARWAEQDPVKAAH